MIRETLNNRITHLQELNDKIFDNYANDNDEVGYALGWEMVTEIRYTQEYINLAIYYIQTTRAPQDSSTSEFLKTLERIRDELLLLISGDSPPIKPYISTADITTDEVESTREKVSNKLSGVEKLIASLENL